MTSKHQRGRPSRHSSRSRPNGSEPDSSEISPARETPEHEQEPLIYRFDRAERDLHLSEPSIDYFSNLSFRLSTELSSRLLLAAFARRWAPEVLAARLLSRGLDQEPDRIRAEAAIRILTPRERDVTRLTALGKTNHEIAYELGIARETVKSHIRSTLAKLGLHSKSELRLLVQSLDLEHGEIFEE